MQSTKSDQYYIKLVLSGKREAFSVIVDRYQDNVYNLALRICGNREDAEEVAQDSFVKVFRSLGSFKGKSSLSTWIYRIVYNTSITFVKKHRYGVLSLQDFPADAVDFIRDCETDADAEIEYRKTILAFALQKLEFEDRAIITMHYYEDMSQNEISTITGLSGSNVKVRLHRARKKMQEIIEKYKKQELHHEKV